MQGLTIYDKSTYTCIAHAEHDLPRCIALADALCMDGRVMGHYRDSVACVLYARFALHRACIWYRSRNSLYSYGMGSCSPMASRLRNLEEREFTIWADYRLEGC